MPTDTSGCQIFRGSVGWAPRHHFIPTKCRMVGRSRLSPPKLKQFVLKTANAARWLNYAPRKCCDGPVLSAESLPQPPTFSLSVPARRQCQTMMMQGGTTRFRNLEDTPTIFLFICFLLKKHTKWLLFCYLLFFVFFLRLYFFAFSLPRRTSVAPSGTPKALFTPKPLPGDSHRFELGPGSAQQIFFITGTSH